MSRTIYSTDFTDYLPEPLKRDEKMLAMAKTMTDKMLEVSGLSNRVLIYSRIDELPEELLDILAYDFHCDWYDTSYQIEVKRNVIKSNAIIHKRLGTKYAVTKALTDVYKTATVQEWFEYGGNPYCFKVTVNVGSEGLTEDTTKEIEQKMWFYKNIRSHCDGIYYQLDAETEATIRAAPVLMYGGSLKVKPLLETEITSKTTKNATAALMDGATLKVKPLLETSIKTETKTTAVATVAGSEKLKVKAYVEEELKATNAENKTAIYLKSKGTLQVRKGQENG